RVTRTPDRRGVQRGGGPRAGGLPPRGAGQPRCAAYAVPLDGADVSRHHRGGRGPAHRGVHQGGVRTSGVTPPDLLRMNASLFQWVWNNEAFIGKNGDGRVEHEALRGGRWLLRLRGRGPW